ncbi:MAG TPA: HEAT repeat domain-containing protein, partial [Planctomycetaceae bacterium]|nr:HEAT repeat domain-containing protein [Planctomycetaceae bacterium]
NPFAEIPVAEWLQKLQSPGPIEDRYRAWSAVTTSLSPVDAWPHVMTVLSDTEAELRAAAAHWIAVVKVRGRIEPSLTHRTEMQDRILPLLADADPDVRLSAAEASIAWDVITPAVSATVLDLLRHPETEATSLATLCGLSGRLPDIAVESVPRLAALLSAEQADVREAAAQALSALGSRSATAATELIAALDDEEPLVREHAARALGQLDFADDALRSALQAATTDEDAVVAAAAQESLARLGGLSQQSGCGT